MEIGYVCLAEKCQKLCYSESKNHNHLSENHQLLPEPQFEQTVKERHVQRVVEATQKYKEIILNIQEKLIDSINSEANKAKDQIDCKIIGLLNKSGDNITQNQIRCFELLSKGKHRNLKCSEIFNCYWTGQKGPNSTKIQKIFQEISESFSLKIKQIVKKSFQFQKPKLQKSDEQKQYKSSQSESESENYYVTEQSDCFYTPQMIKESDLKISQIVEKQQMINKKMQESQISLIKQLQQIEQPKQRQKQKQKSLSESKSQKSINLSFDEEVKKRQSSIFYWEEQPVNKALFTKEKSSQNIFGVIKNQSSQQFFNKTYDKKPQSLFGKSFNSHQNIFATTYSNSLSDNIFQKNLKQQRTLLRSNPLSQSVVNKSDGRYYIPVDRLKTTKNFQSCNMMLKVIKQLYFFYFTDEKSGITHKKVKWIGGDTTGIVVCVTNYISQIRKGKNITLHDCKIDKFRQTIEVRSYRVGQGDPNNPQFCNTKVKISKFDDDDGLQYTVQKNNRIWPSICGLPQKIGLEGQRINIIAKVLDILEIIGNQVMCSINDGTAVIFAKIEKSSLCPKIQIGSVYCFQNVKVKIDQIYGIIIAKIGNYGQNFAYFLTEFKYDKDMEMMDLTNRNQ